MIEEYLKMLEYLPRITGIYSNTLEEFAKRHKIYKKGFFKRQIKAFQNKFKQSLNVFDDELNKLVNKNKKPNETDKQTPPPKKESKFLKYLKGLFKSKNKKQDKQQDNLPQTAESENKCSTDDTKQSEKKKTTDNVPTKQKKE